MKQEGSTLEALAAQIDFAKAGGLVPAVVQDRTSGKVLMLGYMNRAALAATLERGHVVFFSRSKQRLWEKGESSGHYLELERIRVDCDGDTLLVTARPQGPACHTGTASCFGDDAPSAAESLGFLKALEQLIAARALDRDRAEADGSYTAGLFARGPKRIAQKVGEEGVEAALAGAAGSAEELVGESADLLFHLLVLLRSRGLSLDPVVAELERRHRER